MVRYKPENSRDVKVLRELRNEVVQKYLDMGEPLCKFDITGTDRYLQGLEQTNLPFDRRPHIDIILDLLAEAETELTDLSHQEWYYVHG